LDYHIRYITSILLSFCLSLCTFASDSHSCFKCIQLINWQIGRFETHQLMKL